MQKISKLLRNKSGIYCLVNLINGKRYVGSSVNIYNRLHEHLHNLQHNKAHNKHLQSAWNKYGKSAFEYAILQYCDKEKRFELEQYYIDALHPEYNLTEQVIANFGHSPSDECRQQISRTLKQKYSSGEITTYKQDHAWIPCGLYNIYDFQQVNHFKNIADASKYVHDLYSKSNNNLSLNKCKAALYNKYCIISDLQLKKVINQ